MIKRQIFVFVFRSLVSMFGLWLCITWFGVAAGRSDILLFALAGLIFSLLNSCVKPLAKMLTLPIAIFTMGISTILLNMFMLWLTIFLLPGVEMDFLGIFWSTIILSIINGLANLFMPSYNKK